MKSYRFWHCKFYVICRSPFTVVSVLIQCLLLEVNTGVPFSAQHHSSGVGLRFPL